MQECALVILLWQKGLETPTLFYLLATGMHTALCGGLSEQQCRNCVGGLPVGPQLKIDKRWLDLIGASFISACCI